SSTYRSNVSGAFREFSQGAGNGLPADAVTAAPDSLGAALQLAAQAGPAGEALARGAQTAFVQAMGEGFIAASVIALLGAIVALVWLPAHGTDAGETFEDAEQRGVVDAAV